MKQGESRANSNKRLRQEALRESLSAGGHVEHVIEIANKLTTLDSALENTDIQRLKAGADIKLKLIGKYLPDLKATEHSSDPDNPLPAAIQIIHE